MFDSVTCQKQTQTLFSKKNYNEDFEFIGWIKTLEFGVTKGSLQKKKTKKVKFF